MHISTPRCLRGLLQCEDSFRKRHRASSRANGILDLEHGHFVYMNQQASIDRFEVLKKLLMYELQIFIL